MAKLRETVQYIRSKNAGPFWATLEIFCGNQESYGRTRASKTFLRQGLPNYTK